MQQEKLKSAIESLLFISDEPIAVGKLAKLCEVDMGELESALLSLEADYGAQVRGLAIIKIRDLIQLTTKADNAEIVAKMLKSEIQENLSQAALEVLAIIAYRGPISRAEIESIRGVNCSFTLRALSIRGLIDKIENIKDSRRYLYNISFDFLKKMGVESVEKLPDWDKLSKKSENENVGEIEHLSVNIESA
jgi:segregation and condensation protein B